MPVPHGRVVDSDDIVVAWAIREEPTHSEHHDPGLGSKQGRVTSVSPAECLVLIGPSGVGHIAGVTDGVPVIYPVAYEVFDGEIYIRSLSVSAAGAIRGTVAFHVDHVDRASESGWSVHVLGVALPLDGSRDFDSVASATGVGRPVEMEGEQVLRLSSRDIVGCRFASTSSGAHWLSSCPACGSAGLQPVALPGVVNLFCPACGTCWHVDGPEWLEVDPKSCEGCGLESVCREDTF